MPQHVRSCIWAFVRLIVLIFAASLCIFVLLRALPGDPARVALGLSATDAAVAELAGRLGTDQPLVQQYLRWIGGMAGGDLGVSLSSGKDLGPVIAQRAQVSLVLVLAAMVVSLGCAVPAGVWLARGRHRVLSAVTQFGIAVPSFLVGIVLVGVFSLRLGLLPANGWGSVAHVVLPVCSLAFVQTAILTRYVKSAVEQELQKDYVRTMRATGASLGQVVRGHVLRNAALPVLTIVGIQLSTLVVGAVVVERVFAVPGLGSLLLDAVGNRDLPTVQAVMMVLVVFTLVVNFLVDVTSTLIDPRIRGVRA